MMSAPCPEKSMKIFIWQASIEHIHYFTWRALQSLVDLPIQFIVGTLENEIRKNQNWKFLDLRDLNPILLPQKKLHTEGEKLIQENLDAIHVFWGFRGAGDYNFFPLIFHALRKGARVVVIDEAYTTSPVGYYHDENIILSYLRVLVRPWLRFGMAKVLAAVSGRDRLCIIALSMLAKKQLITNGAAPEIIFPFGYFVPRQEMVSPHQRRSGTLRLIFVGALIRRKGLDILMKAVANLHARGYKVELNIYGAGNETKVNLDGLPISYKRTLPFDEIQCAIADHDLLILPSRHDGWGVVVNEALLQGVPVIASTKVGAKQLIEASGAGLIFESENIDDLVEKIRMVIDHPGMLDDMKTKACEVGQEILPEKAAGYFLSVIKHYFYQSGPCPSAVWSEAVEQKQ